MEYCKWTSLNLKEHTTATFNHNKLLSSVSAFNSWDYLPINTGLLQWQLFAITYSIYKSSILLNHLYLALPKYLPKSAIWALLVHINIFLWVISSFIFNHFIFKSSVCHFLVPRHFTRMCLMPSSPTHKGHSSPQFLSTSTLLLKLNFSTQC